MNRGKLRFTDVCAPIQLTVENCMVLLVCRFLSKDPSTGGVISDRFVTLHLGKVILGALFTIEKGETKYNVWILPGQPPRI